eukprot:1011108-Pelagomonas_calceolata.AAC.1
MGSEQQMPKSINVSTKTKKLAYKHRVLMLKDVIDHNNQNDWFVCPVTEWLAGDQAAPGQATSSNKTHTTKKFLSMRAESSSATYVRGLAGKQAVAE